VAVGLKAMSESRIGISIDHTVFERFSQSVREAMERIGELVRIEPMRVIDMDVARIAGYSWDEDTIREPDGTTWDRRGDDGDVLDLGDVIPDYSTDLDAAWTVASDAFEGVTVLLEHNESDGGHKCTIRAASRSVVARDESPAMAVCLAIVEYHRLLHGKNSYSE